MDGTEQRANGNDDFDDVDSLSSAFGDDEPTEEERKSLRRIADQLPWPVWYSSSCLVFTSISVRTHTYQRLKDRGVN